jgi:hypothetical protein
VKQRTRIVAAIMIGLSSYNVFASLSSMLVGKGHGSLFQPPDFVFGAILGALVNATILAGWIYLIKNRVWAWTMLVWLMAFSCVGMLFSVLPLVCSVGLPFPGVGFMPFPFGWAYIPALVLLLKDKPSEWSKIESGSVPHVQQPGDLKKRTSIVAWVCLVYSAISFLSLPLAFVIFRHRPGSWLSNVPGALLWALWIPLLGKRVWAWRSLVAAYAALSVWYVWSIAHTPAYYAAHHKVLAHSWYAMIPGAIMLILMVLTPLWALLADKPSGWARSEEAG